MDLRPAPGDEEGAPPPPKRMRRQHSFGGRNRACLILHCVHYSPGFIQPMNNVKYNIFIVDDLLSGADIVDDDVFARVSPTFQIDCGFYDYPLTDAFCVFGGKLYMFEGCSGDVGGKSVFAIDLALETRKLVKGGPLMTKIGDMSSQKEAPVALPTPDGQKIVVFPTMNFHGAADDASSSSGFELFEPAKGSWEQLPSIPGYWDEIDVYGYIDNTQRLLVQTMSGAICVIDLASPDKHWKRQVDASAEFYSGLRHIPPHGCEASFFEAVLGRRFCCVNLFGFYDLDDHVGDEVSRPLGYGFSSPEEFGLGLRRGYTRDSCASLLNYDEREIHFCHLLIEKPSSENNVESCRLAMCVCRVDVESYKQAMDQLRMQGFHGPSSFDMDSSTTMVKAHKFTLAFDRRTHVCAPHLFFTF